VKRTGIEYPSFILGGSIRGGVWKEKEEGEQEIWRTIIQEGRDVPFDQTRNPPPQREKKNNRGGGIPAKKRVAQTDVVYLRQHREKRKNRNHLADAEQRAERKTPELAKERGQVSDGTKIFIKNRERKFEAGQGKGGWD